MTTSDRELASHYRNEPLFRGVYCQDEMKGKPKTGCYVVNLQPLTDGSGTHWAALVLQPIVPVPCWIDSYGVVPPNAVAEFMRSCPGGTGAIYSKLQYQKLESENCGYFAVEVIDELLEAMRKKDKNWKEDFDDDLTPYPSDHNEREVRKLKLRK